ncbi:MAG: hypothetical protein COS88_02130 [Chloroflexi bacterium CG07_land_8_20_14_0_80_51_10]|nr:MAG: hypothetical protein COS88_02130 [Chloroflexi bacterium CG07_land_8_20_14_0_80_51_10]
MEIVGQWLRKVRARTRNEQGLGLVEAVVAVGIVASAVVAFVTALSAGSMAVRQADEMVMAESLARNQLEYVKGEPYDSQAASYPLVEAPDGYAISVEVISIPGGDDDIQHIVVTIQRGDENVLTVEEYKVNR